MNNKLKFFPEPKLAFRYGQSAEDSRDGLTLFGPFEEATGRIKVGVIGTKDGIYNYSSFVNRINKPIFTQSLGRPSFPGFSSVFGLEWPDSPTFSIEIDENEIEKLVNVKNLKERTYQIVSFYLGKIKKYLVEEDKSIDIWYVIVPMSVYLNCRPKSKSGKATISKQRIEIFQSGQLSLFDEEDEIEHYNEMYESASDFHDQLKARAIFEKIQTPIQIMLEDTLLFKSKVYGKEYNDDMKAHLAWTHSSSLYYKLGYLPWKLTGVREGVCYVGLVFKKIQSELSKKGFACSAAQMFLDSGDGVVFRGNIGPWMSKDEKTYHLNKESARDLLKIAVESYKDKHGSYPREMFIHGRASFTNEEWEGFTEALKDSPGTKLVGVKIIETDGFRIFKDNPSEKNVYGVMRGLSLIVDEKSGYLWTKGYIPKTETTNHLEVARPLGITIDRGDSDIEIVMQDILCLTKLNYNACIYGDGLPVTLRFSDQIGNILTAIPAVNWPAKSFKYYI